jgi:site-specific DNA recombinase
MTEIDEEYTRQRAVAYLRVASPDAKEQRRSVKRQRAACRQAAERLGVVLSREYLDLGASGNKWQREGLQRLLTDVAGGGIGYVVVSDRARLARNHTDERRIQQTLQQAGASLSFADAAAPLATADPSDTNAAGTAVIYLRVSTKEQAKKGGELEGYSIPAQREACRRKASSLQAVVVDEFADRGESAKSADRPELQRLLQFVQTQPVNYVIVHKLDRLARNRVDDVAIHLALQQAGVKLVSVSENIDESPSGLLLHGIMSSIAEFYSRNLATEAIKGSVQKAKKGGTPGRVPLGYRNVRRIIDGEEVRTVELDEERAPLMAWAFEAYATGDWTILRLLAELTRRGLTTAPGPKTPSKPLSDSQLHALLRHPYYRGLVRYRGVLYPGKHPRLVSPETWQRVQEVLSAKYLVGEKQREHPHYLKGSIHCGTCGSRLIVNHAKGRGGIYPYFVCIGRQKDKHSCSQRALRIELVEEAVVEHYATVQLPEDELVAVRACLEGELTALRLNAQREQAAQERRRQKLEAERQALLDAHLAEAVPLDLLKRKQDAIAASLESIESCLAAIAADFQRAETNLKRAMARLGDCETAYREASETMRRQFNLAFFEKLLIDEDYTVRAELAPPFDVILGDELRSHAARGKAPQEPKKPVRHAAQAGAQNQERPREVLVGAGSPTTPYEVVGWSQINMVGDTGLEPVTSALSRRRSPS